jgi:glycosyltransferase involved in cell wall biosynthesis
VAGLTADKAGVVMGYVCAFRGRRDNYQVPLALAEAEALDCFLTDHYCGWLDGKLAQLFPRRTSERLQARFEKGLPEERIVSLPHLAFAEAVAKLAGLPPRRLYETFDPRYGRLAARYARHQKSDLFMYSSYAWEAFTATCAHSPRKILFQFHPHFAREKAILGDDSKQSKRFGISFKRDLESDLDGVRQKSDAAWRLADHIVCASTFTETSLLEAGADPSRISVIPYGVDILEGTQNRVSCNNDQFHALYVGSGIQRKGLHHLLMAWRCSRLPTNSLLTVVARAVDPGLKTLLREVPNVRLLSCVSKAELRQLYFDATLFVLPSLVEGFGQVYIEALSCGVPVLGTTNTCLPDLGTENDSIFITEVANVDELVYNLERLSLCLPGDPQWRRQARNCAARFSWERFRRGVRMLIDGQRVSKCQRDESNRVLTRPAS